MCGLLSTERVQWVVCDQITGHKSQKLTTKNVNSRPCLKTIPASRQATKRKRLPKSEYYYLVKGLPADNATVTIFVCTTSNTTMCLPSPVQPFEPHPYSFCPQAGMLSQEEHSLNPPGARGKSTGDWEQSCRCSPQLHENEHLRMHRKGYFVIISLHWFQRIFTIFKYWIWICSTSFWANICLFKWKLLIP